MIKHHPNLKLLQSFSAGELPASLSAAISIHVDMCPVCQAKVTDLTEQFAENCFDQDVFDGNDINVDPSPMLALIDSITVDDSIDHVRQDALGDGGEIVVKEQTYVLPRALRSMPLSRFSGIGKLTRARVELDEGEIHTSLLQIQPGGMIPEHTHKGFEVTLLLDGEFSDDMGTYEAGDFIMLDGNHQHNPKTEDGCLCLTVVSDALHFTQGFGRLLNPFGSLLY
ncbi:ChrR family anti-sigma-E factor [Thalassotalea sp. PS06]|uniref:ChrR family anti-sigma-E factor n=1 Tax=Thalassotalea sp. PS06 TaxID=2594005 RepID=UPI0011643B45|nr:ChrR family anti-sigma-E factor [Thalassotalea sp. PS06]QDP02143.1 transcriptional regulator [Thalassotalea sp. PS06]